MLRGAVEKGFKEIESFKGDPDLDPLRDMPEFQALVKDLEENIELEKL